MGRRVVQSRRMKLLCSVLLGTVFGQYEDYGAYGYSQYSAYEYDQYGNKKNKKNQYVAPSYNEGYNSYGKQYGEDEINLGRFNGLHCWSCDARVSADVDVGADAATNAFKACIANGANQACRGEQRVCMTETRARYDRVYAIHASQISRCLRCFVASKCSLHSSIHALRKAHRHFYNTTVHG